MAKPKFNPEVIKQISTSGGLQPVDFMRPVSEQKPLTQDTPPPKQSKLSPKPVEPKAEAKKQKGEPQQLSLPPARKTEAKVLLPIRVKPETAERVRHFARDNDLYLQDIAEYALIEFLESRGAR